LSSSQGIWLELLVWGAEWNSGLLSNSLNSRLQYREHWLWVSIPSEAGAQWPLKPMLSLGRHQQHTARGEPLAWPAREIELITGMVHARVPPTMAPRRRSSRREIPYRRRIWVSSAIAAPPHPHPPSQPNAVVLVV